MLKGSKFAQVEKYEKVQDTKNVLDFTFSGRYLTLHSVQLLIA